MGLDHGKKVSVGEAYGTASAVDSRAMTTAVLVIAEEVGGNVQAMAVTGDLEDAMTTEDLGDVITGPHVNGFDIGFSVL